MSAHGYMIQVQQEVRPTILRGSCQTRLIPLRYLLTDSTQIFWSCSIDFF